MEYVVCNVQSPGCPSSAVTKRKMPEMPRNGAWAGFKHRQMEGNLKTTSHGR